MNRAHREAFLMAAVRAGLNDYTAKRVTALASTHHRLSEAECNGDWPCDNGQRETVECPLCACYYHPSVVKKNGCPTCRVEAKIRELCKEQGVEAEFQGDPRGWTVNLRKAKECEGPCTAALMPGETCEECGKVATVEG